MTDDQLRRPSNAWAWLWRLTPWGRTALAEIEHDDREIAELRAERERECQRYADIERQSDRLEDAARRNGFVNQLSAGFKPRMS